MTVRDHLLRGFQYDLWANESWLRVCDELELRDVMEHIVTSQERWLGRCGATSVELPESRLEARLKGGAASWIAFLSEADLDRQIQYATADGVLRPTVGDIALHILTHGAYHRGELRGRCAALGYSDYEDTDLTFFLRTERAETVS
jgi:uncharacterized damage-inducible protein DinB